MLLRKCGGSVFLTRYQLWPPEGDTLQYNQSRSFSIYLPEQLSKTVCKYTLGVEEHTFSLANSLLLLRIRNSIWIIWDIYFCMYVFPFSLNANTANIHNQARGQMNMEVKDAELCGAPHRTESRICDPGFLHHWFGKSSSSQCPFLQKTGGLYICLMMAMNRTLSRDLCSHDHNSKLKAPVRGILVLHHCPLSSCDLSLQANTLVHWSVSS